ncbi:MAG: hypothetical protein K9M45_01595 [Kiritimatiellales bacterium]|nr:hypothetical protein [Kiritimatiellales bacterium]
MWTPILKLGSVNAVNNDNPDFELPVNGTYRRLFYVFKNSSALATVAAIKTAINYIRLEATDQMGSFPILQDLTPAQLFFRELYYGSHFGVTNEAGMIEYDPSAIAGRNADNRRLYALGTADLTDLKSRIEFSSDVTGVTSVELYAEYDKTTRADALGAHTYIMRKDTTIECDHTGLLKIDNLPKSGEDYGIAAIHFQLPGNTVVGDVTMTLNTDDDRLRSIPKQILDRILKRSQRRAQASYFSLDFAHEDTPLSFQRAGQRKMEFELNITTAPGGAVPLKVSAWVELCKLHPLAAKSNA